MRTSTLVIVVVCAVSGSAYADPTPPALLDAFKMPPAVLVGAFGGGHGHATRAPHGWFFGADTGIAWLVGASDVEARTAGASNIDSKAWCFGARAGYQLASGLAVQARFDKLGLDAPDGSGELVGVSTGIRYSLPVVPMPFAEALVGSAIHGSDLSPMIGLGVGASLFVARHLSFDASLRDWIVDIDGMHHVPTLTLGISAGFGG